MELEPSENEESTDKTPRKPWDAWFGMVSLCGEGGFFKFNPNPFMGRETPTGYRRESTGAAHSWGFRQVKVLKPTITEISTAPFNKEKDHDDE